MAMDEQLGVHDTVPSQVHEDTLIFFSTDASCTVYFFHITSSHLEEDDSTGLLHEYPSGPTMWVYRSNLLLGLLLLTSNSALLKMLLASETGHWFLHQR